MTGQDNQFDKAHVLAERLFTMQTAQTEEMKRTLAAIQEGQVQMQVDLAVVKASTENLPSLSYRVDSIEKMQDRQNGFIAAIVFLAGIGEWLIHTVFHK